MATPLSQTEIRVKHTTVYAAVGLHFPPSTVQLDGRTTERARLNTWEAYPRVDGLTG